MSAEHVVKWTCNRCGVVRNVAPGIDIPSFWMRIETTGYYRTGNKTFDFCPKCADKFNEWLDDFIELVEEDDQCED